MKAKKRILSAALTASLILAGCNVAGNSVPAGNTQSTVQSVPATESSMAENSSMEENSTKDGDMQNVAVSTTLDKIDMSKWNYNEEDNVYWQVGISYCETPAAEEYETLGIFVPGEYMTAKKNADGSYACTINVDAAVGEYTSQTAPVVIPVDTPGYMAMAAPTGYASEAAQYTKEGFVYVKAGCRGRDAGAPAGVTDLKAAIRYIRYSKDSIPANTDRFFSFGMSGGGAQSALLGATGDSELYTPYLGAIGAVSGISDAVMGSMCWCPITNLDYANEAYEWNLGVTRTELDEEMQQLSDQMAKAFAQYVNELRLTDENGVVLTLTESKSGVYQAGTYYEYLKQVIEQSLNHFLQDTIFPYDAQSSGGRGGFGRGGQNAEGRGGNRELGEFGRAAQGEKPDGTLEEKLPDGVKPDKMEAAENGQLPDGMKLGGGEQNGELPKMNIELLDNINRTEGASGISLTGTYDTAQDYIDALNAETTWVIYDSETNTATITSIADFVKALKPASKNIGAFDDLEAAQGENVLFGYGDGSGAHFDPVMADLLKDNEQYGAAYAKDLEKTDFLGNTVAYRMNMYNPMYYIEDYYEGYQTSDVAKYWRIRTGINQGDTALSTEVNLALALENYGADVDFETVWGQGHVEAERTGNSAENFIAWVKECLG